MIKINRYEDIVTQIMLGREIEGTVYYWTAAYLVDGLLVDTGCAFTAEELVEYLRDKRIEHVVNTHHHEDHVGGNALIQKEVGLEITAHPLSIPLINRRPCLHEYQEMVWGYPEPSKVKPVPGVITTDRYSFKVIATPGHCPDHISLYEPNRGWCFSGDLFVSENQKVFRADEDIFGIINSLQGLLDLPEKRLVLFTSIGKVFTEGREALRTFLEHLRQVQEKVAALNGSGLSAEAIRDAIFGRESGLAGLTAGHYSISNLIRKLLDGPC